MDAALGLLDEGVSPLPLREVARRAGVSAAAPYHHFGSRDGLLGAVAQEGFAALGEALEAIIQASDAGPQRVRAMAARYFEFALQHPAHYQTMFDPERSEDSDEAVAAAALASFERLVREIGHARPDLDNVEHQRRARMAWALTHGAVMLSYRQGMTRIGGPDTAEAAAQEVGWSVAAIVMAEP
ncbi:MAG: TetR/AcrR family transcriptional regulator [Myxococcota bacterium]